MATNLKVVGASWLKTRISTFILIGAGCLAISAFFIAKIERPIFDGTYCATMYWTEKTGFNIEYWKQRTDLDNIPQGVARICYKDSIYENGWSQLEIETDEHYPDWVQAFGAGSLEGTLTWSNIYHHWANTISTPCDQDEDSQNFCTWLRDTLSSNYLEMKELAKLRSKHDHYWHQIHLFFYQLEGVYSGWQRGAKRARSGLEEELSFIDFLLLNSAADIEDLKTYFNQFILKNNDNALNKSFLSGRASMLMKLFQNAEGNWKLLMGHSSAGSYSSMLRVQKRYKFKYHFSPEHQNTNNIPGTDISFSGYPGILASTDDFYMIRGRKMHAVVGGIAIKNQNSALWNSLDIKSLIPLTARIMAANRLGQTQRTWDKAMSRNVRTGSKQWILIDLKKINLLQKMHSKTRLDNSQIRQYDIILLSEQVVGEFKTADVTEELVENGTTTLFNGVPYFQEILDVSGISKENFSENINEANMTTLDNVDVYLRKHAFRGDLLGEQSLPYGNIDMKLFLFDPEMQITDYHAISGPLFTTNRYQSYGDIPGESLTIDHSPEEAELEIYIKAPVPLRSVRNDILAIAKHRMHHHKPFKWSEVDDGGVNHQGQPNEWNFDKISPTWAW